MPPILLSAIFLSSLSSFVSFVLFVVCLFPPRPPVAGVHHCLAAVFEEPGGDDRPNTRKIREERKMRERNMRERKISHAKAQRRKAWSFAAFLGELCAFA